ncbi:type II toxin-antitoxin system death-on-curing family toxin [Clostridium botulinum]|uniref:type II toxin-antitoxin system death-on-curing family toxin n=1 Tax=Clostridium botulinum TaxID=1491 RepID=UPI0006A40B2A|nr:type II toxin-antitoxin system death-on-curing family toxin [Clostridium botulinum]KOC31710.1 death-on-curing protein [Clostridium botulinum]
MKYISVEYILKLHTKLILATGGSDGIRDIDLLKSALQNSKATFGGIDLYPSIQEKCASICYSIINNHAFIDGNKRIGLYVMLILLEYNNIKLEYSQNELVELGLGIAKGEINQQSLIVWINNHRQLV